jgi:hypothetical protein
VAILILLKKHKVEQHFSSTDPHALAGRAYSVSNRVSVSRSESFNQGAYMTARDIKGNAHFVGSPQDTDKVCHI